jgi:hypothetical protein
MDLRKDASRLTLVMLLFTLELQKKSLTPICMLIQLLFLTLQLRLMLASMQLLLKLTKLTMEIFVVLVTSVLTVETQLLLKLSVNSLKYKLTSI